LIDYENIQPKNLVALKGLPTKIIVFVGAKQPKLPFELVSSLQALGDNAEYIKIGGNGSNALDFHIAYYIGRLAECDPDASFHIISKDTGFDPLIKHLKEKKIFAQRNTDLSEKPLLKKTKIASSEEQIDHIVKSLSKRGHARPRKVKTLENTINALFDNKLDETKLKSLIEQLRQRKHVIIENVNVSYGPPISQP
jgi:hypothetical protein